MASFQNNAITERGISLRTHVDMGAVFTATKIVIGSGYIPAGKTAKTMTDVVSPVKELIINKKERSNDGKAIFGGAYTNEDITTEFYFRELALYAKAVYPDGTEVEEVLYSYGNAADSAELMAAYSTSTVVERQLDIVTFVGNDAKIDLTIQSGLYLSHAEKHAAGGEDPVLPNSIFAVTLGTDRIAIPENADINEYLHVGGYKCPLNATVLSLRNCPVQTAFTMDVVSSTGDWAEIDIDEHSYVMQRICTIEGVEYFRPVRTNGEGGIIFDEWEHTYTTHQPPTSAEIGAVNKTGDELSGDLSVRTASPRISAISATTKGGTYIMSYGDAEVGEVGYETAEIGTVLRMFGADNDDANALKLIRHGDGFWNQYNILHTGNAPTVVATAELV